MLQSTLGWQADGFCIGFVVNPGEGFRCKLGLDGGLARAGDDAVAFEAGADGGKGGFFDVVVTEEHAVLAVEHGVAADEGVLHLEVAIEDAVGNAVDQGDGGAKAVAFEVLEVIVEDLMVFANDADAAGAGFVVAEEEVLFDDAAVSVAKGECAFDFNEGVGAVGVAAGFVGDALGLAVAGVEEVFFNEAAGVHHGAVTVSNAQGFTAVFAQFGARTKVVVVKMMVSWIVFSQPNDDRGAFGFFAFDAAVVKLVGGTVKADPTVFFLGGLEVGSCRQCAVGDAAVIGTALGVDAELEPIGF